MRRRELLSGLAGIALALPWPARAQQAGVPVVGFIRSTPSGPFGHLVDAFRAGLRESGYVEGENVAVEYRWADNDVSRLPGLVADLLARQVAVIVGNSQSVEAARAATTTIPIVFVTSDDPVQRGLVASLGRPAGNLTGITFFGVGTLGAKRLELLHEIAPEAKLVALLVDPGFPAAVADFPEIETAARSLGLRTVLVTAAGDRELEQAFDRIGEAGAGAVLVSGSPIFTSRRRKLVQLAAQRALPAIYDQRDHVAAGGLVSYAASFTDAYRQAGIYAGRILGGSKPSELPVLTPARFELVLNLRAARSLGLEVPQSILLRADEVIE